MTLKILIKQSTVIKKIVLSKVIWYAAPYAIDDWNIMFEETLQGSADDVQSGYLTINLTGRFIRCWNRFSIQKCENSRFYFMSMISFVGFNIISGWYQDKRFVGFLLPTSLFLFWTKKTLKWEIALGESRTALRTALSHMLFQTFGEGRNYSFGWDWNFFIWKRNFSCLYFDTNTENTNSSSTQKR